MVSQSGPEGRCAFSAKMGEKGQTVIPKEVREMFGFRPGDTLLILCDPRQGVAIPTPEQARALYSLIFGGGEGETP